MHQTETFGLFKPNQKIDRKTLIVKGYLETGGSSKPPVSKIPSYSPVCRLTRFIHSILWIIGCTSSFDFDGYRIGRSCLGSGVKCGTLGVTGEGKFMISLKGLVNDLTSRLPWIKGECGWIDGKGLIVVVIHTPWKGPHTSSEKKSNHENGRNFVEVKVSKLKMCSNFELNFETFIRKGHCGPIDLRRSRLGPIDLGRSPEVRVSGPDRGTGRTPILHQSCSEIRNRDWIVSNPTTFFGSPKIRGCV